MEEGKWERERETEKRARCNAMTTSSHSELVNGRNYANGHENVFTRWQRENRFTVSHLYNKINVLNPFGQTSINYAYKTDYTQR